MPGGTVMINATPDRMICAGGDNDGRPHGDGGGHGGTPGGLAGSGSGGLSGAAAAEVIRQVARRGDAIKSIAECPAAIGMAASTAFGYGRVAASGGRTMFHATLGRLAAGELARLQVRNFVPNTYWAGMAVAADASAVAHSAARNRAWARSVATADQAAAAATIGEIALGGDGSARSLFLSDFDRVGNACR